MPGLVKTYQSISKLACEQALRGARAPRLQRAPESLLARYKKQVRQAEHWQATRTILP